MRFNGEMPPATLGQRQDLEGRGAPYLPGLDGIRAIAIAGVFALHLDRAHFPGGAFGVDVFFVLSAYLITSILLRELQQKGAIEYGAFYWRRVFRLAPALVLWLILLALPTALLQHDGSVVVWSTAGALFYFNDFLQAWTNHVGSAYDQSWSLAVEEQFYLVWPLLLSLLVTYLRPVGQRRTVVALVVVAIVVWLLEGNYFLPTGHLPALALGCWAAFQTAYGVNNHSVVRFIKSSRVATISVIIFAVAAVYAPAGHAGEALAFIVCLAATGLTLHCVLAPSSLVGKLLASAIPRWIGKRSYAIYLYGLTSMQLVPVITHLPLHEAAFIDVFVTGVLVALSYRFVESPLRNRGRQWLARRGEMPTGRPVPVVNARWRQRTGQ